MQPAEPPFRAYSIIRGNDYIFRSEEQQHSFNYPVQAGTNSKDTPIKDAQRFNIKVQKDDVRAVACPNEGTLLTYLL